MAALGLVYAATDKENWAKAYRGMSMGYPALMFVGLAVLEGLAS